MVQFKRDEVNPILFVPLDLIVLATRQRTPEQSAIDRVAQSFLDVGLLMPIGIDPNRVLIFGATRLAAAKQLGWETIEAREFESAEDPEVRALMEWEENDARSNLTLEEQMAYKRSVVDPILKARAAARQRAAAEKTNASRWGEGVASGNFPEATPDAALRQSELGEKGDTRDLVGKYLQASGKTIEKFESLANWSEDASLPDGLREEAAIARERANVLGKVDGEFKRVKALKELLESPPPSELEVEAELEQKFVRAYSRFEEQLEGFDAAEVGPILTEGSWNGLAFVLGAASRWAAEAEAARNV